MVNLVSSGTVKKQGHPQVFNDRLVGFTMLLKATDKTLIECVEYLKPLFLFTSRLRHGHTEGIVSVLVVGVKKTFVKNN